MGQLEWLRNVARPQLLCFQALHAAVQYASYLDYGTKFIGTHSLRSASKSVIDNISVFIPPVNEFIRVI